MTLRKFAYVIVGLCIVLTALLVSTVQAEKDWKIDSLGVDWQYGKDFMLPKDWQGDHCANTVNRVSIRLESDSVVPYYLNESWDKWTLGLEGHYSDHKADERPDRGQDAGFKEIGFNVTAKRHLFDELFYVGFIAGLSYVGDLPEFENRDWKHGDAYSNIGRSHCLGSWGATVGKDWKVTNGWSIRTEGRLTHTSDPFRSDSGKNFGATVVGVTYRY